MTFAISAAKWIGGLVLGFSIFWIVLSVACCMWVMRSGSCKVVPPSPIFVLFYPFILAGEYLPDRIVNKALAYLDQLFGVDKSSDSKETDKNGDK